MEKRVLGWLYLTHGYSRPFVVLCLLPFYSIRSLKFPQFRPIPPSSLFRDPFALGSSILRLLSRRLCFLALSIYLPSNSVSGWSWRPIVPGRNGLFIKYLIVSVCSH